MMKRPLLIGAAIVAMLVNLPLTLLVAPAAANFSAPLTQRIFYYHVPAAWVAYLAFAITAAASFEHLRSRSMRADRIALASAEIGTVFAAIALVTGLLWARVEFLGYSAIEDPKVVTLVVLIGAYVAYLALRASVDEAAVRARLAAVFGILALLGVPLSYFASRASLHPDFTRPEQSLDPRLGLILLYSTFAFTLLYAALAALRHDLALVEARLEEEDSR